MPRNARLAISGFFLLVALAFLALWPITLRQPLTVTYPDPSPSVSHEYGIGQGRIWFDEITRINIISKTNVPIADGIACLSLTFEDLLSI